MCLIVKSSYVKSPIPELEVYKTLEYSWDGFWVTPYQYRKVPTDKHGLFQAYIPSKRKREFKHLDEINIGFLHAYNREIFTRYSYNTIPKRPIKGKRYIFKAIAYNVIAIGEWNDIVCRQLYIPAFDSRKYR